jgi:hypothetical protein
VYFYFNVIFFFFSYSETFHHFIRIEAAQTLITLTKPGPLFPPLINTMNSERISPLYNTPNGTVVPTIPGGSDGNTSYVNGENLKSFAFRELFIYIHRNYFEEKGGGIKHNDFRFFNFIKIFNYLTVIFQNIMY